MQVSTLLEILQSVADGRVPLHIHIVHVRFQPFLRFYDPDGNLRVGWVEAISVSTLLEILRVDHISMG